MSATTHNSNNDRVIYHVVKKERLDESAASLRYVIYKEGIPLVEMEMGPENHVEKLMEYNMIRTIDPLEDQHDLRVKISHSFNADGDLVFAIRPETERDFHILKINLPF